VAPVLEIGRCRREETVKRVRNPEGGTNRVWKPGSVDLRAGAAVGAKNLRRVAGVVRLLRSLPGVPWRGSKSMEGVGASVPARPSAKDRVTVKTVWRVSQTKYVTTLTVVNFEGRDNPTRVGRRSKERLRPVGLSRPWRGEPLSVLKLVHQWARERSREQGTERAYPPDGSL
jgi:hypothetical protein